MSKAKGEYGNDSIKSLSDKEAVRLRPANMLGSDDVYGAFHTVKEMIDNSVDEVKAGYGEEVIVTKYKDGSFSVQDYGRGVPLGWNTRESKYNYELIYGTLNAGGKYSTEEDGTFNFPKGTNGLGSSITAFTAEDFFVESVRDGEKSSLVMKEGDFVSFDKESSGQPTGTFIKWKPDLKVFKETNVPFDWIKQFAKEQAIVNAGAKIIAADEANEQTYEFVYKDGIQDYLGEVTEGVRLLSTPQYFEADAKGKDREDLDEYRARFQVAFVFNNEHVELSSFHNSSSLVEGGSPFDAVKSAFPFVLHKYITDNKLYQKKEKRVSWEDIADSLFIITNTYSMQTSYKNQTKHAISNEFVRNFMNQWLRENLEVYFIENPKEAKTIAEQVLINKRSSEKAEKTRTNIKNKLERKGNIMTDRIENFEDCRSKDPESTEFFIVEGRSAAGAIIQGRNAMFQAVYPIRGKILSCLKASNDKIFKNEIVTSIYKILDCGVELKGKKSVGNFEMKNLRYNKVIIACDADADGNSIRTLLLTMFYTLSPSLLREGKIYIVDAPLFEIYDLTTDQNYYAYTDEDKNRIIKENNLTKYTIDRNKGLGEMDKEAVSETLMNPETRKLYQVTVEDVEEMVKTFELFMGDEVLPRREFIENHFDKYDFEV